MLLREIVLILLLLRQIVPFLSIYLTIHSTFFLISVASNSASVVASNSVTGTI